jgi:2-dehydropantoate 2-reductase
MKNIAVIGIGGVGGFFGGKLTRLLEHDPQVTIYFIARGHHLQEIQAKGLLLDTEDGQLVCKPTKAMERIADLPRLDYCLVCVKGYDLVNVLSQLKDKIDDATVILPLLNGVDIFERIREVIKVGYLHPACVYIGTHIEKPGLIWQRGPLSTIFLGHDPGWAQENRTILPFFDAAGIKYGWKDDPFMEIWNKYIFIASFGLVTADSGMTIGELFLSKERLDTVRAIMGEIVALGRGKGIGLSPTIIEDILLKASKFPFETKTSFQRDVELKDRPDERDLFGGSILRLGRELGIPTPATGEIYASISRRKPYYA